MNVRTTRIPMTPEIAATAGTAQYEAMVTAMRQVDGFLGAMLLVDRATGDNLGLTFWESEDAMHASEEVANKQRRDSAAAVGATGAPSVERFEVAYYAAPQPEQAG